MNCRKLDFPKGLSTTASGSASTAMGFAAIASGNRSTAMGIYTKASDYGSLVIGHYNLSVLIGLYSYLDKLDRAS